MSWHADVRPDLNSSYNALPVQASFTIEGNETAGPFDGPAVLCSNEDIHTLVHARPSLFGTDRLNFVIPGRTVSTDGRHRVFTDGRYSRGGRQVVLREPFNDRLRERCIEIRKFVLIRAGEVSAFSGSSLHPPSHGTGDIFSMMIGLRIDWDSFADENRFNPSGPSLSSAKAGFKRLLARGEFASKRFAIE